MSRFLGYANKVLNLLKMKLQSFWNNPNNAFLEDIKS